MRVDSGLNVQIHQVPSTMTSAAPRLGILLVVESSGAGTGRHVLDLAEGLMAHGCAVHLIYSTARMDARFKDRLGELKGLASLALPMRTGPHPSDFGVIKTVHRYLKEHGPFDIIHGHSSKGGAIARLAAIGTGTAAFYTLHGLIMMDPGLSRIKRWFYLAIELALSLRTSRIIAVSPEEARAAVKTGMGGSRVITVPNGVGPAELSDRATARRALGLGEEAMVIGFVGRIVDQKAPQVLVEAFAATAAAVPGVRLVIVGAGPLLEPMQELGKKLNVADKIHWLGERDAREVFAAFDIFALSSRKEGLPYVVLEAMAAGLPIVATVSAGVEILIDPGVNGFSVPTDDIEAFTAALVTLASEAALVLRYGQASLKKASDFTIKAMVDRTLAAYQDALRRKL